MRPVTEVAVGIVFSGDGKLLFGQRPSGKPYAGWWEFPGGKLERGETVEQALTRELHEELGITCTRIARWAIVEHEYAHAHVRLHFCRVLSFEGVPQSRENQSLAWRGLADIASTAPILPAAIPVLRWLQLPNELWFTRFETTGLERGLAELEAALRGAKPSVAIVLREPGMNPADLERAFYGVRDLCHAYGAKLLISSRHPSSMARAVDGVHLSSRDLLKASEGNADFSFAKLLGVSAHNQHELALAASIGANYACLSPVLPTSSHPGALGLGWETFAQLANHAKLPVYALGGMTLNHLEQAIGAGAQGIASRSDW